MNPERREFNPPMAFVWKFGFGLIRLSDCNLLELFQNSFFYKSRLGDEAKNAYWCGVLPIYLNTGGFVVI